MKLIDILVQELPKRGGWIKGHYQCAQDKNGEVCFYTKGKIHLVRYGMWSIPEDSEATHDGKSRVATSLADDYAETIITREQYKAALAGSKPEWDGEGLPPVGSNVEALFEGEWVEVTVAYCDCPKPQWDASVWSEALVFNRITTRPFWADEFRPIRSEEEKKRDEAIAALKKFKPQLVGELAGYLYDDIAAGKIPHIRID